MARGTSYYQQSNTTTRTELKNGQYKWHNKEPMSEIQKALVGRVAEKLDLDEKQAFELADLYFAREPEVFVRLAELEKLVQDSGQAISQPGTAATQQLRLNKKNEFNDKLNAFAWSLTAPILELYYSERLSLLKAQTTIASVASNPGHPLHPAASSCIDSLFQRDKFEDSLWDMYFKYRGRWLQSSEHQQQDPTSAKTKLDWQERERYCEQMLKEEFAFLQFLFVLYYRLRYMNCKTYLAMMDHFNQSQFQVLILAPSNRAPSHATSASLPSLTPPPSALVQSLWSVKPLTSPFSWPSKVFISMPVEPLLLPSPFSPNTRPRPKSWMDTCRGCR